MTILLHKPYLVILTTCFMDDPYALLMKSRLILAILYCSLYKKNAFGNFFFHQSKFLTLYFKLVPTVEARLALRFLLTSVLV